jgi:molybdate transport system substrate-binding protein
MLRILFLISLLCCSMPIRGEAGPSIVVFAGAASQPPLEEAADAFQTRTGIPVVLHFGGSGAILNQVRLTGQGDIYIPGSPDYMDKAVAFKMIAGTPITLAYLVPALIVAEGNPLNIQNLNDLQRENLRIGIADPDGVCVGLYAVEMLEANGILDQVRPNLRGLVESCAKAAAMIPLNMVDVVIGWREFAAWHPETMDAVIPGPDEIPRLGTIPAAMLDNAKNPQGAEAFITFLASSEGQSIFQRWGYLTDESRARQFAPEASIGGTYSLREAW